MVRTHFRWLKTTRLLLVLFCLLAIGGCITTTSKSTQQTAINPHQIPDPVPKQEAPSRYGNPPHYEVLGKRYWVRNSSAGFRERGRASWYGPKFHGKRTSSGTPYNMYEVTAAHKSLPIPTYARVTRLDNGRSVVVRINDRGPFIDNRIIDLSYVAAAKLDMINEGTAPVEVVALPPYQNLPSLPQSDSRDTQASITTATLAYLQVGAFSLRQSAEQLQAQLTRHLNYAVLLDSRDKDFYKVRIGPVRSQPELMQLQQQLAALGFPQTHITYK